MSKNKKYSYNLEKKDQNWSAQIIRRASKNKTVVSKQQDDFNNENDAKTWAEEQLILFSSTMAISNQRHGEQRKANEEIKRERSQRRADKTQKAKDEKDALKKENELTAEQSENNID